MPSFCYPQDGTKPVASLGHALKLPRFLEPRRKEIEAVLPPLERAA